MSLHRLESVPQDHFVITRGGETLRGYAKELASEFHSSSVEDLLLVLMALNPEISIRYGNGADAVLPRGLVINIDIPDELRRLQPFQMYSGFDLPKLGPVLKQGGPRMFGHDQRLRQIHKEQNRVYKQLSPEEKQLLNDESFSILASASSWLNQNKAVLSDGAGGVVGSIAKQIRSDELNQLLEEVERIMLQAREEFVRNSKADMTSYSLRLRDVQYKLREVLRKDLVGIRTMIDRDMRLARSRMLRASKKQLKKLQAPLRLLRGPQLKQSQALAPWRVAKVAGKSVVVVDLAIRSNEVLKADNKTKELLKQGGGMAGNWMGTIAGGVACTYAGFATFGVGFFACGIVIGGGVGVLGGKVGEMGMEQVYSGLEGRP